MEEAVESAIELYKLEAKTANLPEEHASVQELYSVYEDIYEFLEAVKHVEKVQLELKECQDEDAKKSLESNLETARAEQQKVQQPQNVDGDGCGDSCE